MFASLRNKFFTIEHVRFVSLDSQFNINLLRFASIFNLHHIKMFASLRKYFFFTIHCVRFASISKKTPLSKHWLRFASLRYRCHYWPTLQTRQRYVLHRDVSTPQEPELHLDVSTLQRPVLLLEMSTPQDLELHQDVSTPRL